jgi:hypothetical protein
MNGERYRGASLRSGLSMRHEGKPPARASNGGAGYSGGHMVLERMIAMDGPPQRGRFLLAAQLQYFVLQLLVAYFWQNEAKMINVFKARPVAAAQHDDARRQLG